MVRKAVAMAAVLLLGPPFAADAEERFGVVVYPGAKYDDGTSKALKDAMHIEAACFRTGDSVAKVFSDRRPTKEPCSGKGRST